MLTGAELFMLKCVAVFTVICAMGFWLLIIMFFATVFNYINKKR